MTIEQKKKMLFNAYNDYTLITTEEALKHNKLTFSDFQEVFRILNELNHNAECVQTICKNASEWFKKRRFNVIDLYGHYGVCFE